MPGLISRRPRGARRLSARRADRPHGWYRVQACAGNVVSDKRSAAASPWRKADDTGSVVLTPIGRFAVMAELVPGFSVLFYERTEGVPQFET